MILRVRVARDRGEILEIVEAFPHRGSVHAAEFAAPADVREHEDSAAREPRGSGAAVGGTSEISNPP